MAHGLARRTPRNAPTIALAAMLLVLGALVAVSGVRSLTSSPAAGATATTVSPTVPPPVTTPPSAPESIEAGRGAHRGPLGEADGAVPEGITVFDDAVPGVARLDAALLVALRAAATAAGRENVTFLVDSGWRSGAYQGQLLQEAIATYGSAREAARWVATPTTSPHVSGEAVDLGHDAAVWLARHGRTYGLCPIYRNEPWHFELRPDAVDQGCPPTYADPTHDPRMQQ